jgi:HEAT repeat protein
MALGDLAGGVAVPGLAQLAAAASAEARLVAVDALGKIGGPHAVEALMAAAGDVNETVRAEVARALGQLALADMQGDALETADVDMLLVDVSAGDPSEYVREVADEALAALREASLLPSYPSADRTPAPVTSVTA